MRRGAREMKKASFSNYAISIFCIEILRNNIAFTYVRLSCGQTPRTTSLVVTIWFSDIERQNVIIWSFVMVKISKLIRGDQCFFINNKGSPGWTRPGDPSRLTGVPSDRRKTYCRSEMTVLCHGCFCCGLILYARRANLCFQPDDCSRSCTISELMRCCEQHTYELQFDSMSCTQIYVTRGKYYNWYLFAAFMRGVILTVVRDENFIIISHIF